MVISFCRIAEKILFCPCFIAISLCAYRHFIQILYWISSDSACLGVSCNSDRGLWICLGRQFGRCPELNASRSLRRISQRRYFCVQLPPRRQPFLHSPNKNSPDCSELSSWIVRLRIAGASNVRHRADKINLVSSSQPQSEFHV